MGPRVGHKFSCEAKVEQSYITAIFLFFPNRQGQSGANSFPSAPSLQSSYATHSGIKPDSSLPKFTFNQKTCTGEVFGVTDIKSDIIIFFKIKDGGSNLADDFLKID